MKKTRLREVTFSEKPNQVDRDKGVISHVKILGAVSKNGRRYLESAMKSAVGMYEGQQVNVDHRREMSEEPRGIMEQVGIIQNPTIDDTGIYGDLHMLMTHPSSPALMERAEKFPASFGLSHDANGSVNSDGEEDVVEEITAVNSVDIVSVPATNDGLFESVNPKRPKMGKSLRDVFKKAAKKNPFAKAVLEAEGDSDELKKALDAEATPEMDAAAEVPPEEDPVVTEMDPADPAAAAEPDDADPVAAVKASLAKRAAVIFADEKMDASAKVAALKKLLIAQDKVTAEMSALTDKVDATAESVKQIADSITKLLEAKGLPPVVGVKHLVEEADDGNYKSFEEIANLA